MLWSSAGYTCLVIMPGYLQSALHTGMNQALLIAVIANVGFALTIIPAGIVSDRVGRRRVMVSASVLLLLMAMPLLKIVQADGVSLLLKALVVLIAGDWLVCSPGRGLRCCRKCFQQRYVIPGWVSPMRYPMRCFPAVRV